LLGAATILNELKSEFEGTIKLVFQPGEERLPGGASIMIKEGVLKNPDVEKMLGQHVMPLIDAGKVGFRKGLYMASADEVYITVYGKGGHAAHPHQNIDPIAISAQLITALQTIVSRSAKPSIPSVLSIGKIVGLGATNIIPDKVEMEGTFRTFNEEWRAEAHDRIVSLAKNLVESMGGTCDVEVKKGYPFLKNDEVTTEQAQKAAIEYLGEENVEDLELWPAGEDFAYYSQAVPSCFYRLGIRNESENITSMLHTPTFNIDEKALETGSGLMAFLAISALEDK
jgi:amidohydrolase